VGRSPASRPFPSRPSDPRGPLGPRPSPSRGDREGRDCPPGESDPSEGRDRFRGPPGSRPGVRSRGAAGLFPPVPPLPWRAPVPGAALPARPRSAPTPPVPPASRESPAGRRGRLAGRAPPWLGRSERGRESSKVRRGPVVPGRGSRFVPLRPSSRRRAGGPSVDSLPAKRSLPVSRPRVPRSPLEGRPASSPRRASRPPGRSEGRPPRVSPPGPDRLAVWPASPPPRGVDSRIRPPAGVRSLPPRGRSSSVPRTGLPAGDPRPADRSGHDGLSPPLSRDDGSRPRLPAARGRLDPVRISSPRSPAVRRALERGRPPGVDGADPRGVPPAPSRRGPVLSPGRELGPPPAREPSPVLRVGGRSPPVPGLSERGRPGPRGRPPPARSPGDGESPFRGGRPRFSRSPDSRLRPPACPRRPSSSFGSLGAIWRPV